MLREIIDFHQDELGDWVADLECLHAQHVRHRPPFLERAWVETSDGRADHLGMAETINRFRRESSTRSR